MDKVIIILNMGGCPARYAELTLSEDTQKSVKKVVDFINNWLPDKINNSAARRRDGNAQNANAQETCNGENDEEKEKTENA